MFGSLGLGSRFWKTHPDGPHTNGSLGHFVGPAGLDLAIQTLVLRRDRRRLPAGSQPPMSCQLVHLPARLGGVQMAHHVAHILADAVRKEMRLDAVVEIAGVARVMRFLERRFSARVESHVVVDPVFLDVVQQQNTTETHLLA